MDATLRDLLAHQFWADAELWTAIAAHPPARDDKAIHDRFHHIHMVQRAFMYGLTRGTRPFVLTRPNEYPTFDDLRAFAHGSHDEMHAVLDHITGTQLDEQVPIPWFKNPPLTITAAQALTQCAMHSHHHRGQNATRLRELGGVPPSTDLIVWYWKGRPVAGL